MQNAELDIMLIGQMFLEGAKFAQVHVRTDSRFRCGCSSHLVLTKHHTGSSIPSCCCCPASLGTTSPYGLRWCNFPAVSCQRCESGCINAQPRQHTSPRPSPSPLLGTERGDSGCFMHGLSARPSLGTVWAMWNSLKKPDKTQWNFPVSYRPLG